VNKFTKKYIPETARDKMASEFLELRQGLMNVSQYDQKFAQLSRYADALVKSEAERTKRFVKGLRLEIRGRLIPLQLKNYLQAVERALEVEMDMQEGHEGWVKEIPNSKRPRCQGPTMTVASRSTSSKGFGFNATLQRGGWARGKGTWLRNKDTFSKVQATSVSHPRISEAPWCQKCRANHFGNCLQDRACYNCGGVGHLKKNCLTRRGSQE